VIIDPTTDLTGLKGARVVIDHGQTARIAYIAHGAEAVRCGDALHDGVWGACWYDRHGDDQGGNSSFWWPYGTDLTVEEKK
jgi:hypothetical protein